jgi:hypothetical protein
MVLKRVRAVSTFLTTCIPHILQFTYHSIQLDNGKVLHRILVHSEVLGTKKNIKEKNNGRK